MKSFISAAVCYLSFLSALQTNVAAAEQVRSSFDGKVKPQRYALTNLMDTVEQVEGLDEQQPHETERHLEVRRYTPVKLSIIMATTSDGEIDTDELSTKLNAHLLSYLQQTLPPEKEVVDVQLEEINTVYMEPLRRSMRSLQSASMERLMQMQIRAYGFAFFTGEVAMPSESDLNGLLVHAFEGTEMDQFITSLNDAHDPTLQSTVLSLTEIPWLSVQVPKVPPKEVFSDDLQSTMQTAIEVYEGEAKSVNIVSRNKRHARIAANTTKVGETMSVVKEQDASWLQSTMGSTEEDETIATVEKDDEVVMAQSSIQSEHAEEEEAEPNDQCNIAEPDTRITSRVRLMQLVLEEMKEMDGDDSEAGDDEEEAGATNNDNGEEEEEAFGSKEEAAQQETTSSVKSARSSPTNMLSNLKSKFVWNRRTSSSEVSGDSSNVSDEESQGAGCNIGNEWAVSSASSHDMLEDTSFQCVNPLSQLSTLSRDSSSDEDDSEESRSASRYSSCTDGSDD
ncbi:predicted protein [Thalassiosira pseudonana CCMP1335]|uniref:Uncharacterized protein n=1 Tax=Thalassiosira pseudonana TaxID=35128 RepID=B8BQ93_THAPS|nr:predicted protein [Thalassiosira pseudonana CCMP1335]EED96326.1 predicted protein [Thalassiosira pseudonana CCMP1335]